MTDSRTSIEYMMCLDLDPTSAGFGTSPDAETRLLIANGKLIYNSYENPLTGTAYYWGPYIITIKVWQKK